MKTLNIIANWAAYIGIVLFCVKFMALLIIDTIENTGIKVKKKSKKKKRRNAI